MPFPMRSLRRFLLWLGAACCLAPAAHAAFVCAGRQLLRDGAAFAVQGVCYHPVPVGVTAATGPAWGDYFTADSAALQARDLPLLRALGANTVRVYGWAPGVSHQEFLDQCYNGGVAPIYVLVNLWIDPATDWTNATAVAALAAQFAGLEDNLARHPAVLGMLLGNETNAANDNGDNPAYWAALETVAAAIKARNPDRLVSVPITDALPQVTVAEAAGIAHIDFWSLQVYRGTTFGTLFADFAARSGRPLVLTEMGLDAYDHRAGQAFANNGAVVADALTTLWREIQANAATVAGGCVFAWTDDLSRRGTGFVASGFPDGYADEGWWGLYMVADNGAAPDLLTPRAAVARLRALWVRSRFAALSARAQAGTDAQTLTLGFVFAGGSKSTMLRGVGPGLLKGDASLAGRELADPVLTLFELQTVDGAAQFVAAATNDEWGGSAALREKFSALGMGTLDGDSHDAAWLGTPARTVCTAQVSGVGGTTGVALAEVYDAALAVRTQRLAALSVRNQVGTGVDQLIVGFVIVGDAPKRVIFRGVGPGLVPQVESSVVLADPYLQIQQFAPATRTWSVVGENDNWGGTAELAAAMTAVGMGTLATDSTDAVLWMDLPPGVYTAQLSGVGGTTGVGLVEIYEVP